MDLFVVFVIVITAYAYAAAALSGRRSAPPEGPAPDLLFVLLVPMLNEGRVIASTLQSLLQLRGNYVLLLIDDASDDDTLDVVRPYLADARVRLLARQAPKARTGKGEALNAGYAQIAHLGLVDRYGPERLVTVVFDADGRVDPGFLEAVAPFFIDPGTAGVQSAVRMYNARRNLLTGWQHAEFTVWNEVFCRAKDRLGSTTLGGNGQCVRYSALAGLGQAPWQPSLTEDLDLSLRLLLGGWRVRFCGSVAVWQEAVPGLRALVRQRSRWLQGHLVAWAFVPAVVRSRLPLWTRADLLTFLLLPIVFVPIGAGSVLSWLAFVMDAGHWSSDGLVLFYVLAFGVVPLAAETLSRAEREPLPRAVVRAHLFVFYSFVWFLASLVACWNVVLGRRGWIKTTRIEANARLGASGLVVGVVSAAALLLTTGSIGAHAQVAADTLAPSAPNVLVINQASPSFPVAAQRRGAQITLALRHFTPNAQAIDDRLYTAGELFGFDRVVVIANDAVTQLPAVLRADLVTSGLPVLWLGYDLDQVPELAQRAGVFLGDQTSKDLPRILEYRGHQYPVQPDDINLLRTAPGVQVLARYIGRQEVPYIVHGGTLWYVNGLPEFDTDSPDPATDAPNLVFADVLHDFFGTGVPPNPAPRAVIRLEDVSVHIDPRTIRAIADDLSSQHVPFAMGVIPAQRFEDGSVVPISDRPAFADSLRYAQDHGGTIILHGYHHTFGSGEDFEFWDPDHNAPLAGDNEAEVASKVEDGIRILRDQGLEPRLWETPHYSASPLDYQVFARYFSHAIENREPVSWLPYPASPDQYGQTLIPENLGYINPDDGYTVEGQLARARLLRIVRDAWGVGFYHPASIDRAELDRLIDGLRRLGYTFADLRDQPLQTRSSYSPLPHEVALNRARQEAASVDVAIQLPAPPPRVRGVPVPSLPWPTLGGLGAFGVFLFRLRAQWQPAIAPSVVDVSTPRGRARRRGWVVLAAAGVMGTAGVAGMALVRGPETAAPRFDAQDWELSVYYTAVEDFYSGPETDLVGCPAFGCLQAPTRLGSFPEDFLQAVKDEGSGRITRGPSAGQYLNWSVDVGYWLDTDPRDARGEPLRAYQTAAADERVAFGTPLQVLDCGQDVLSQERLPAPVCQPLSTTNWVVWDRFGQTGVGKHVDLYIGEQDQPDFVRRSSRVINTMGGTVLLGASADGQ